MSASGVPQEYVEIIMDLELMECELLDMQIVRAPEIIAQGLTCLAHDYVQMGFEEKAHSLLLKADEIYPNYHKEKMHEHMKNDPHFSTLVVSLTSELILVALSTARDRR